VREDDHANYLSRLASQFLTSQKTADIIIFHESLDALDVRQAHVALFEASNLDSFGMYRLAPSGDEMGFSEKRFRSHHFPPAELCSHDKRFSLALLPLIDHDEQMGFVAFDASNLEPCASLVRQLSATFVHARRHEQVLDLSQRDGLTGLYNRRYLDAFLRSEIERCARYGTTVSVLLLDLDHFKSYNDTFGHLAGDEALRQLAATITKAQRGTDVIARYGGEEFAVVLPETNLAGAKAVAEHIRIDVMAMNWLMRPVTVSIGVAIAEDALTTSTALLQCDDHALYASKTGGRNRVTIFHPPEENVAAEPAPA
jgi:diguanylate cyclase (GGDEF)-like protein